MLKFSALNSCSRGQTSLGNRLCPSTLHLHLMYLKVITMFELLFFFSGQATSSSFLCVISCSYLWKFLSALSQPVPLLLQASGNLITMMFYIPLDKSLMKCQISSYLGHIGQESCLILPCSEKPRPTWSGFYQFSTHFIIDSSRKCWLTSEKA